MKKFIGGYPKSPRKKSKQNEVSEEHKKLLRSKNIEVTNTGVDVLADILNIPIIDKKEKK